MEEKVKDILAEVLQLKDPIARRACLRQACSGDEPLRREVESLLKAFEQAGDFFNRPMPLTTPDFSIERTGMRIGRYKLLEKIGEGGFGVVYMAEQIEPVQRKVALKIIKAGMDTREVIARFEAERQALALMDHPNIAHALDAGATEAGRPYFVMELVNGIPITDYCDRARLSTLKRLQLFIKVCHAVQHAHQKGIIHRDLKPNNVLVTLHDGEPVPKVIDFGVAKALGQKLTEKTLFTSFQNMIGTPAYMSPEQAELSGWDIDTRSDIYSLGVLLYELLTGVTPFEAETFRQAALDEIRRMIRESEPSKPSTRLQTLGVRLKDVAKFRHTDPAALRRLVKGDLDWIVMKCLEKDRTRRYETANGLAMDLGRYLKDESVSAAAPALSYQLTKFGRRHRAGLATAAALTFFLLAGTAVSTIEAMRASRAERAQILLRERAELGRANEAKLYREAEAGRKQAQAEASKSRQVSRFLEDMLRGVGPSVALGRDTTLLREVLDKTAARAGTDLTNQPEVEAELRSTLSTVYRALGDYGTAEAMERRALAVRTQLWGEEHPEIARSLNSLAVVLCQQGKYAGAEDLCSQALAMRRKLLGDEHPEVADSLYTMGGILHGRGRLDEAAAAFNEAIRMHGSHNNELGSAAALASLGRVLQNQGRAAEAEPLLRTALAIELAVLPSEHPTVVAGLNGLASALASQGRLAEAEALQLQGLAMARRLFGRPHPAIAGAVAGLVNVLQRQGKAATIEELFREELVQARDDPKRAQESADAVYLTVDALLSQNALPLADRLLDEVLPPVITSRPQNTGLLFDRATLCARRSRFNEAAADFASVISRDPTDHDAWYRLAILLAQSGDAEAYRRHCCQMLFLLRSTTKPTTAETAAKASLLLPATGAELEAAAGLADRAILLGTNHPFLPYLQLAKGLAEYRRGHYLLAQDWLLLSLGHGWSDANLRAPAGLVLGMTRHQLGQSGAAKSALGEATAIIEKGWPQSSIGDLGGDWFDGLIAQILSREANALILKEDSG